MFLHGSSRMELHFKQNSAYNMPTGRTVFLFHPCNRNRKTMQFLPDPLVHPVRQTQRSWLLYFFLPLTSCQSERDKKAWMAIFCFLSLSLVVRIEGCTLSLQQDYALLAFPFLPDFPCLLGCCGIRAQHLFRFYCTVYFLLRRDYGSSYFCFSAAELMEVLEFIYTHKRASGKG